MQCNAINIRAGSPLNKRVGTSIICDCQRTPSSGNHDGVGRLGIERFGRQSVAAEGHDASAALAIRMFARSNLNIKRISVIRPAHGSWQRGDLHRLARYEWYQELS